MEEEKLTLSEQLTVEQIRKLKLSNDKELENLIPKETVREFMKNMVDIRKISMFKLIMMKLKS